MNPGRMLSPDAIPRSAAGVERDLFLASMLALFMETALIRWLPSTVKVLSYFTNFVLIACFLGFGIGLALSNSSRRWTRWMMAGLGGIVVFGMMLEYSLEHLPHRMVLAVVLWVMVMTWMLWRMFRKKGVGVNGGRVIMVTLALVGGITGIAAGVWFFSPEIADAFFIFGGGPTARGRLGVVTVTICFIATALALIPVGQRVGELFDQCEPIRGYVINIAGSAAGVLLMALLAYFRSSPWIWFSCLGVLVLALERQQGRIALFVSAVLLLGTSVMLRLNQHDDMWSPYYKIQLKGLQGDEAGHGFKLTVNNDYHQKALNLLDQRVRGNATLLAWRQVYDLPYVFNRPKRVLVVGAGTGNDVAAALRSGAEWVDAVEIDPMIQEIGRERHPERPYSDPRVNVHIGDARTYLRNGTEKYDAIVYGYLDSHSLFSTLSSVRLDNFVYTREAFQEAFHRLKPGGVIVVSFCVQREWIGERISLMLKEVTGRPPLVFRPVNEYGEIFVAGPGVSTVAADKVPPAFFLRARYDSVDGSVPIPTDDWPYLYMQSRSVLNTYAFSLAAAMLASVLLIGTFLPDGFRPSWRFFFLGAGFMLIETRGIVSMSLLYGSTWIVNSAVIFFVLVMILLANLIVLRWRPRQLTLYYMGLFLSLVLSLLVSVDWFLRFDGITRVVLSGIWVTLPIFFAGVVFAISFQSAKTPSALLGINLLGAVAGGLLEYLSLVLGFWSLGIIAGALYLAAALGQRE